GKTGFTDEAGYCLSASAKRNDMRLISVVMGAKSTSDRFSASSSLLNYGFNNYKNEKIVSKDSIIDSNIKIKGLSKTIQCKPKDDLFVLQKSGEKLNDIEIVTDYLNFKNHIDVEEIVGHITIMQNGDILAKTDLISVDEYNTPSFIDITHAIFDRWSIC
ncbi:MAG: D-alanyl-D-alanine carboxypeptidase, partial [Clostridia bacterium]|nr:D-alanyl-D-alanine carboxypeptidase [Clostridia bacterium]